jgi:hypothetical protein
MEPESATTAGNAVPPGAVHAEVKPTEVVTDAAAVYRAVLDEVIPSISIRPVIRT